MKHLFVPYHIALRLKELGFDEPCFGFYGKVVKRDKKDQFYLEGGFKSTYNELKDGGGRIDAPLYQQVVDWLREKHKIVVWVEVTTYANEYNYRYYLYTEDEGQVEGHKYNYYYEALEAVITHALTLLP